MAALERVRLSPWLVVLLAAGYLLGEGAVLVTSLVFVVLHEAGHVLCAAACGCEADVITIAPFGGAAQLRGLEQLSAGKNALIALAGPAVNAMLYAACGCGMNLMPEWTDLWQRCMTANLVLMLFNLLPALPLDGGRVLCALLQRRSGAARAQRIAAVAGILLGAALMLLGAYTAAVAGKVNLTLLICGGYVAWTACRALKETPFACLQTLMGREKELRRRRMLPVRTIAVRCGTTDAQVAALLHTGAFHRVVYLDQDMRVQQEKWETELF